MKVLRLLFAVCACGTLGCATGLMEPVVEQSGLRILAATSQGLAASSRSPKSEPHEVIASDQADESPVLASANDETVPAEPTDELSKLVAIHAKTSESADLAEIEEPCEAAPDAVEPDFAQQPDDDRPGSNVRLLQAELEETESSEPELASTEPEQIQAPPAEVSRFKPASEDEPDNRLDRSVANIAVDIRPPIDDGNEELPQDLAEKKFAGQPTISLDSQIPAESQTVVGPTPWGFCFRPLYFEEVYLERYGREHGLLQSGISGTQFFVTFAALPYKMTVRPPRSCVCSNGFSRCGDEPPPNYGRWYWRWDAAAVELAAVTGVVFILP